MTEVVSDDERDEELSSIAAIFPELCLSPDNSHTATLSLEVSPSAPLATKFRQLQPVNGAVLDLSGSGLARPPDRNHDIDALCEVCLFQNLPALQLHITLPDGYPEEQPPKLNISSSWLPPSVIFRLDQAGQDLWEEYGRSQCVYAFIDLLQQEADGGFGFTQDTPLVLSLSRRETLVEFDTTAQRKKFDQATYDCGICLEPKKGSSCYKLQQCGHVFCIECLRDFYNSAITEGDVPSVKCLAPDCGRENMDAGQRRQKKDRALHPKELLQIPLTREQVQRYVDLKLKKMLDSDKNTVYCPRSFCQAPARSEKIAKYNTKDLENFPEDDDEEPVMPHQEVPNEGDEATDDPNAIKNTNAKTNAPPPDRLQICSKCSFAFCKVCQKSWHGELINCIPRTTDEISADEQASLDYVRLNTSPCPTCASPCQKTHGCNQ